MSNRNFDASIVTGRLRDKNVAQQIYGAMRNGRAVGNPQTMNANASIMPEYNEGVETVVELGLGAKYSFDLGGIANYVALDQGVGAAPAPAPPPAPTVPGAPTNVSLTPGNTTITVNFTPPNNGGSSLILYEYEATSPSIIIPVSGTVLETDPPLTQFTITDLENGAEYSVKLRAQNSVGFGPYNDPPAGPAKPATVPDVPTTVTATAGNTEATVSFTPGSDGGDSPVTYTVTSSPGGITATGGVSPITVRGLTNNTPYTFTVVATNSVGSSAPSEPSNPPVIPSGVGGNVNLIILGDAAVTTLATAITTAKTNLSYSGTLNITTQKLDGYDGSTLPTYDIAILYTNGGLNLNATLGANLNAFVASRKHLIMASFCWGNVSAVSALDYNTNSTYAYKGSYSNVATNAVTYSIVHPITTGIPPLTGVGSQNIPTPITATSTSTVIATFNDSNTTSFIATKQLESFRLVGINLYVASAYASTPNLAKYVCNSVYWCMGYLT